MKVFGIGLNKTGTKTLGSCFRTLGLDHMSCRRDLLAKYRAGAIFEVFKEIDRHESFEDWPYPVMYRELFFQYDDAKFVLTQRRDAPTWLDSLKRHSLHTDPANHCRLLAYGYAYPHGVEAYHLNFYERHALEVRQFFTCHGAQDRLLEVCWESGDGWERLCRFLGRPMPAEPFPHENRSEAVVADSAIVAENIDLICRQLILLGLGRSAERFAAENRAPAGNSRSQASAK